MSDKDLLELAAKAAGIEGTHGTRLICNDMVHGNVTAIFLDDDQKMLIDAYREFFMWVDEGDILAYIQCTPETEFEFNQQQMLIAQLGMLEKMTQAGLLEQTLDESDFIGMNQ